MHESSHFISNCRLTPSHRLSAANSSPNDQCTCVSFVLMPARIDIERTTRTRNVPREQVLDLRVHDAGGVHCQSPLGSTAPEGLLDCANIYIPSGEPEHLPQTDTLTAFPLATTAAPGSATCRRIISMTNLYGPAPPCCHKDKKRGAR